MMSIGRRVWSDEHDVDEIAALASLFSCLSVSPFLPQAQVSLPIGTTLTR